MRREKSRNFRPEQLRKGDKPRVGRVFRLDFAAIGRKAALRPAELHARNWERKNFASKDVVAQDSRAEGRAHSESLRASYSYLRQGKLGAVGLRSGRAGGANADQRKFKSRAPA